MAAPPVLFHFMQLQPRNTVAPAVTEISSPTTLCQTGARFSIKETIVWFSCTCRMVVHQEVRKLTSKSLLQLMEPSPQVLVSSANRKRLCLPFYPNSLIRQRRC